MASITGSVEIVSAPTDAVGVRLFMPRLARALAGGAALAAVPDRDGELDKEVRAVKGTHAAVPWDAALVVPTSGSTGTPRLAVLSRAALLTSADLTHRALGGAGRWLLALPTTHIAGLQVLVRSLRSGLEPAVVDGAESFTVESFVAAVASLDVEASEFPHYASLVPTQLHRLLDDGAGVESLWRLDAVLVGGAAVAPTLLERARDAGVTVVRSYGMTETCGGCVYDGVALDGVHVDVDDEGRVRLRGPVLFDGYLGVDETPLVDGWFVTSDLGTLDDGVLSIDGRVDNVIVSGGEKVPPEAVEQALLGLPGVEGAVVVGIVDVEWGERVVALVTSASDISVDQVRSRLRGELPDAWLPRALRRVDRIPLLASGKPDRTAVRELAADLAR